MTKTIQKSIESKQKQIDKLSRDIEELKKDLDKQKTIIQKTIIIDNVEYELTQHDNGKYLKDIQIPKGWRLLKPWEAQRLWDVGYLRDNWFFVENTNKEEKSKGNVAGFDADSVRAVLICNRYPEDSGSSLGVLLCKDLKEKTQ